MDIIRRAILVLVPMILSLTVHEYAHALAGKKLGDNTAEGMGRLTLNPIAHIDPIGTLLLPLILIVSSSGLFFGWAKPVPVNPTRFSRKFSMRTGMMIVAAAGPLSNLTMAILCAALFSVGVHTGILVNIPEAIQMLFVTMIGINVALFIFNMIPVYPLDGQKVLAGLLKGEMAVRYERFNAQMGSWLLIGLIILMQYVPIIAWPYTVVYSAIRFIVGL